MFKYRVYVGTKAWAKQIIGQKKKRRQKEINNYKKKKKRKKKKRPVENSWTVSL